MTQHVAASPTRIVAAAILFALAASTSSAQPTATSALKITPLAPPNQGLLFVNHASANRSGHLGHALVEYDDRKLLAFFPNCSADNDGHSAVGWMEFKRSLDGGRTWSKRQPLLFSKQLFKQGKGRTAMAEKAVRTDRGDIVLFYLICDISKTALWQPYWTPLYSVSADGGETWSEPKPVCNSRGRIYDAVYQDGEVRALHFANDATGTWWGTTDEHVFELHVSRDGGKSFVRRSVLPFNTKDRGYGSLGRLANGDLIAFIYNRTNEQELDYTTSGDGGKTWSGVKTAQFSRKIRNPQFIAFGSRYFMHGRSGAYGDGSGHMILYTSRDGLNWDHGIYLRMKDTGTGAYSNSIVVGTLNDRAPNRLLIQASHAYKQSQTNVLHWWVE